MAINPSWVLNGIDLTAAPFAVVYNSSDPGTPEQVIASIETTLADGDAEEVERHGNRTYSMRVMIESDNRSRDENQLALAVRAGELVFNPGDGHPSSVFEVLHGSMTAPDDFDAELNGMRIVELTLTCAPFARPLEPVSVTLPTTNGVAVQLSSSGWTSPHGTVSYSVNTMTLPGLDGIGPAPRYWWTEYEATRTLSTAIDLAVNPYLSIRATAPWPYSHVGLSISGWTTGGTPVGLTQVHRYPDGTIVFRVTGVDLKTLKVAGAIEATSPDVVVYERPSFTISAVPTPNGDPSGRLQGMSQVPVKGSQRTPVSLKLTRKGPQRTWLLYTAPVLETHLAYRPNLRQYNNGFGTDANTLSGHAATDSITADIPASTLPPGGYVLVVRTSADITYTGTNPEVRTVTTTTSVLTGGVVRSTTTSTGTVAQQGSAGNWKIYSGFHAIGAVTLPPSDVPRDGTAVVRITVTGLTSMDDVYAFWMGDGAALSIINPPNAAGWVEPAAWIDAPTIERPWSSILVSATSAKSDAWSPMDRVVSWGAHEFRPPLTTLFYASYVPEELLYFPRHHTHVSEE